MANLQLKCPCCGGTLQFDNHTQKIICPYCDSQFTAEDLKAYTDDLANEGKEDTSWDESLIQEYTEIDKKGIKVYSCESCGGEIIVNDTTSSTSCPYCGNNILVSYELSGDLKPNYIIPFKNDRNVAMTNLKKFFKKKPLLPGSFKKDNVVEEIKPLYVPYWIFDADVDGKVDFEGEIVKRWSDSSYDYKEIKHYSLIRTGEIAFDHVPVDGSSKMEDQLMESIEPFDFNEAEEFNSAYLAGYAADRYDVPKETTFNRATERFRDGTINAFRNDIKGYENVKYKRSNLVFDNTNAAYALYPVWILNTKWKDKSFRFAVNGQTGKIAGNLPISIGKSILFWFIFFFVVVGIVFGLASIVNFSDLWLGGLLVGAILGIIIATVILIAMRKKNKNVRFVNGAANYIREGSFKIKERKSFFLYSSITKTSRGK